ncbi:transcription factor ETV7-like [Rhinophrynus dorsalis]
MRGGKEGNLDETGLVMTGENQRNRLERTEDDSFFKATVFPLLQKPWVGSRRQHYSIPEDVICKVPGSLRIHPSLWSKDDVIHWLRWAEEEYSLNRTDDNMFVMNGRALCILTKDDFKNRSPSSGDVLYELLTCIKTNRKALASHPFFSTSIRNMYCLKSHHCTKKTTVITSSHTNHKGTIHSSSLEKTNQEEGPLNLSHRLHDSKDAEDVNQNSCVDGKMKDCRFLWDYLYQLLSDKRYEPYIKWEDKESKIFRVVNPNKLAALWGNHKNRPNMTYEKMSKALQLYYKTKVLKKESGQKLLFRFLKSPRERIPSKPRKMLQHECDDQSTFDSDEYVFEVSP